MPHVSYGEVMDSNDFLFKAKALVARNYSGSELIDKKFVMLLADALRESYEAGCKSQTLPTNEVVNKVVDQSGMSLDIDLRRDE